MGRTIAAVIVGYLAMFAIVFMGLTAAYSAMGADGAFKPNSYEISGTWAVVMLVVGIIAAVVGGVIAAAIGRSRKAVNSLAVVVLVLGLLCCVIPTLMAEPPGERIADVSSMDAMSKAVTPLWVLLVNPIIGVVGVLIGGSLRKRGLE
jgi:hypothetical protein